MNNDVIPTIATEHDSNEQAADEADFTAVKETAAPPLAPEDDQPGFAGDVLKHRKASLIESLASNSALVGGVLDNDANKEALRTNLSVLVDAKVMSQAEADEMLKSPLKSNALSMARKIREYQEIIQHPDIARLLSPGYSRIYQVALLAEQLGVKPDGNDPAKLLEVLQSSDGKLSRSWLRKKRESLKPSNAEGKTKSKAKSVQSDKADTAKQLADDHREDAPRPPAVTAVSPSEGGVIDENLNDPDPNVIDHKASFGVAAFNLVFKDAKLDEWVLAEVRAALANDALALVVADLKQLMTVSQQLAEAGFSEPQSVYLLEKPQKPDASKVTALATFARGAVKVGELKKWPSGDDAIFDACDQIAASMEGPRLIVFGEVAPEGWTTLKSLK